MVPALRFFPRAPDRRAGYSKTGRALFPAAGSSAPPASEKILSSLRRPLQDSARHRRLMVERKVEEVKTEPQAPAFES
jgi:hypothetical protein